jgi:hypothetical protein
MREPTTSPLCAMRIVKFGYCIMFAPLALLGVRVNVPLCSRYTDVLQRLQAVFLACILNCLLVEAEAQQAKATGPVAQDTCKCVPSRFDLYARI